MNHCLKFDSEAAAIKAMPQYRIKNADAGIETWIVASHEHALDPVGTVYKPSGAKVMIEGALTDVMEKTAGWHCNLWIETLPDDLKLYEVFPLVPKQVWA